MSRHAAAPGTGCSKMQPTTACCFSTFEGWLHTPGAPRGWSGLGGFAPWWRTGTFPRWGDHRPQRALPATVRSRWTRARSNSRPQPSTSHHVGRRRTHHPILSTFGRFNASHQLASMIIELARGAQSRRRRRCSPMPSTPPALCTNKVHSMSSTTFGAPIHVQGLDRRLGGAGPLHTDRGMDQARRECASDDGGRRGGRRSSDAEHFGSAAPSHAAAVAKTGSDCTTWPLCPAPSPAASDAPARGAAATPCGRCADHQAR